MNREQRGPIKGPGAKGRKMAEMIELVKLELSLVTPSSYLALAPVIVYIALSILFRIRSMATRPAPAVSADVSRLDPSVHPAVIGSIALDRGYGKDNSISRGLFDQAAASLLHMAEQGIVELRFFDDDPIGADGSTGALLNSLRRRHYRFRYTREPDLPLDQAARRMLYPLDFGEWEDTAKDPRAKRQRGASFQQERKAFDEALLEEAIALGLVEREPALCGHMRGWIFYALEIWLFIGIMPRLGFFILIASFIALLIACLGILPRATRLTAAGEELKAAAWAHRRRIADLAQLGRAPRDQEAWAHALKALVAMEGAERAGNIVEAAAEAASAVAGRDRSLDALLAWCRPPEGLSGAPAAITTLCQAGERSREAEHD